MNKTIAFYFVLLLVLFLLRANFSEEDIPQIINSIPEFELLSHHGGLITEDSLINKYTILNFMYTQCTGICPILSKQMKVLYDQYSGISEVQFMSITIDFKNDTPEVLKEYAYKQGIFDKRWKFLLGEEKYVKRFSEEAFNIISDDFPNSHTNKIFLIDNRGNLRQFYNGTNKKGKDLLVNHLNQMLSEDI